MSKSIKATVSVILSMVILFSVAAPGYAQEKSDKIPTILVAGQGIELTTQDKEEVYPLKFDLNKEFMSGVFQKLNPVFLKGYLTGDYSDYCDAVCDIIDPIFEPIRLDNNGNCPNGLLPKYSGYYNVRERMYRFNYDWRLDPIETADKLDECIDYIKKTNGVKKVNLIGRCLGTNVVAAYIDKYGTEKIEKYLMYCGVLWGTELCSDLFCGRFNVSAEGTENFILNYLSNDILMNIVKGSVSLLNNTGGLNLAEDFINGVYAKIKDDLIPRLIMLTYGTFPSYWSMVSPWDYETAKEFVFRNGRETEYAGLIEKLDNYHNHIQLRAEEILKGAQNEGLIIGNICKYGRVLAPVTNDVAVNADDVVSVYSSSLGAESNGFNKPLDEEHILAAEQNGTIKYISPDKQIDASTCMFPDNTWFIKNVGHMSFPDCIERGLIIPFFRCDGEMTVDSFKSLPQFLVCDEYEDTLKPMTEKNEDTEISPVDNAKMFVKNIFLEMIKLLKNLFVKLFQSSKSEIV